LVEAQTKRLLRDKMKNHPFFFKLGSIINSKHLGRLRPEAPAGSVLMPSPTIRRAIPRLGGWRQGGRSLCHGSSRQGFKKGPVASRMFWDQDLEERRRLATPASNHIFKKARRQRATMRQGSCSDNTVHEGYSIKSAIRV
jgi:hypothetical protein